MMHIDAGVIVSGKSMLVVLCLAVGTIIGELIRIEAGFERFGEWLKKVPVSRKVSIGMIIWKNTSVGRVLERFSVAM